MTMKNKYIARKFLVASFGMALSIVSVLFDSTVGIICGTLLGVSFIIGESIVDAFAAVKRQHVITVSEYKDNNTKE